MSLQTGVFNDVAAAAAAEAHLATSPPVWVSARASCRQPARLELHWMQLFSFLFLSLRLCNYNAT